MVAVLEDEKISVADFLTFDELDGDDYYELIEGNIVKKSAPTPKHQRLVREILVAIHQTVSSTKKGEVFCSPIDVFLDRYNAYQPDIVYVSKERAKIVTNNGIEGAPDLVVEILSPSTAQNDRGDKMKVYKRHAVKEYWIVDPKSQAVEVYVYNEAEKDFDLESFAVETGKIESKLLPELNLLVENIFEE
jgi:Uma2 family endonuclease